MTANNNTRYNTNLSVFMLCLITAEQAAAAVDGDAESVPVQFLAVPPVLAVSLFAQSALQRIKVLLRL